MIYLLFVLAELILSTLKNWGDQCVGQMDQYGILWSHNATEAEAKKWKRE